MTAHSGMVRLAPPGEDYWRSFRVSLSHPHASPTYVLTSAFISPHVMVPQRRLATLLHQARQYQLDACPYHEPTTVPSLYIDHQCQTNTFPSVTTHILADHTDEVWRIKWSPNGQLLASAGKDKLVVIWQLEPRSTSQSSPIHSIGPIRHLRDHKEAIDCMAWSADSRTLVIGADKEVYIWDVETGKQRAKTEQSPHTDTISAIQWCRGALSDGTAFIVSSMDCKMVFYVGIRPLADIPNPHSSYLVLYPYSTCRVLMAERAR